MCNTKNTDDLVVRSGKVHTCSVSEINETEYAIEGFYCYSDFNPTVLASDLALIKLNITHATKNIRPVCLKHGRKRQQIKSDDHMVYFGWGNIASMTPDHAILNKSISTIVKKRKCRSSFLKEGITKVENSIFCTVANISDACTGNPGSGVVAVDGNKHLSLQGVISKSPISADSMDPSLLTLKCNPRIFKIGYEKLSVFNLLNYQTWTFEYWTCA